MFYYVVYPTNGAAKTFNGTLLPPTYEHQHPESVCKIYDEAGRCLYQTPIMLPTTPPIDIEIDISNCLSIKIEMTLVNEGGGSWEGNEVLIKNATITTSDY